MRLVCRSCGTWISGLQPDNHEAVTAWLQRHRHNQDDYTFDLVREDWSDD